MHTILDLPLSALNWDVLQDIQTRYPNAVLRVETDGALDTLRMDEGHFWAIIAQFDWSKREGDAVMQTAIDTLAQFPIPDIERFYDLLAEKLYVLDALRFATELYGNGQQEEGSLPHFSVDDFLYARCGVVARGQTFYESVLHNPTYMPQNFRFESILYLPHRAHECKTGRRDFKHVTPFWYETFSNPEGWPGIVPLKDLLNEKY
jgi:hypothetical protein